MYDDKKKVVSAHDVVTGGIEGGLGVLATDPLLHAAAGGGWRNPLAGGAKVVGKKLAIGASVGAAATGLIGAVVSAVGKRRRAMTGERAQPQPINVMGAIGELVELGYGDAAIRKMYEGTLPKSAAERALKASGELSHRTRMSNVIKKARSFAGKGKIRGDDAMDINKGLGVPWIPTTETQEKNIDSALKKNFGLTHKDAAVLYRAELKGAQKTMGGKSVEDDARALRKKRMNRNNKELEAISSLTEFADARMRLAEYKLRHEVDYEEKDRATHNISKGVTRGALAGAALPLHLPMSRGKRVAVRAGVGAALGGGAAAIIRAGSSKNKYGDRTWEEKQAEAAPAGIATGVLAGSLAIRGASGLKRALSKVKKPFVK
jgi:hypothetical protein